MKSEVLNGIRGAQFEADQFARTMAERVQEDYNDYNRAYYSDVIEGRFWTEMKGKAGDAADLVKYLEGIDEAEGRRAAATYWLYRKMIELSNELAALTD